MLAKDVCVRRPMPNYALYKMSFHNKSKKNPVRESILFSTLARMKKDGLSNFYRLNLETLNEKKFSIFSNIKINVGSQPQNYIQKFNITIVKN